MKDSSELNRMLIDRIEEVCMHLLPGGSRKGNKWVAGGLDGAKGDSLEVTISGGAAGRFIDFANPANDKGGTPLYLWMKTRGITFPAAIKEASDWLGVRPDEYGVKRQKPKTYARPDKEDLKQSEPNTAVMDYLTIERKLDPIIVAKSKILETPDGKALVFQYADQDPESGNWVVAHRKYLKLARPDGKKDSWSSKGTKRCLYGKNLVDVNTRDIILTEGEIDALSWQSMGFQAVSIPNGVSDMEWVDIDWDWLSRFEKIYVSTDMDDAGRAAAPEICKRLGLHRTYIVSLPKKDANECLTSGASFEDMAKALATAKPIDLDEIKRPSEFQREVCDLYEIDPTKLGEETPWSPEFPWRLRRGEFTILTGFSGHGKTAVLNQLMVSLLCKDIKIMDASLEVKPATTLYGMTRCALGERYSHRDEIVKCIEWINNGMFFLDCIGTVSVDRLMQAMEYARKRHGIDVFVIDSLFKCGLSGEDYAGARAFVDRLTSFCNNTGAHVILVAHSRKVAAGNELSPPSKSDVAGSSDITNAAFNVIVVWRNKAKKRKLDEAVATNNLQAIAEWEAQPDGKIILDKQRFGDGEEGEIQTWFNKESLQFHTMQGRKIHYFSSK